MPVVEKVEMVPQKTHHFVSRHSIKKEIEEELRFMAEKDFSSIPHTIYLDKDLHNRLRKECPFYGRSLVVAVQNPMVGIFNPNECYIFPTFKRVVIEPVP